MRRTTVLTRLCGGFALVAVAVAIGLTLVRLGAPAPWWDVVVALGAAALTTGGWILACRVAPAVRAESPVPEPASIPRSLRKPPHDWGLAAGAALTIVTPIAVLRFGFSLHEGPLTGFVGILALGFGLFMFVYVATDLLGHRLGPLQRVLFADAAEGQVHAVRVRIGAPVWTRHQKRGDKPGTITAEHSQWLEVSSLEDGVQLRVYPMYPAGNGTGMGRTSTDLLQAGLQLAGHEAWLCLPTRWKLIEKGLPTALVSSTGHVVWGELSRDTARRYVTDPVSGATVNLHPTSPDRPSAALPGRAKFRQDVHGRQLLWLSAAFALVAPALLGQVTGFLGSLLCLGSAFAVTASGLAVTRRAHEQPGTIGWTVREHRDPAIR
ncbi:hypothetical protein QFZ24_003834 [Streptomyces phaeochromogenes]|uniref:hypothetical protein n=1 Tax=Streptomyces phaeochromogenes TaxID=1923 RepID=UPI00279294B1|nr:hypothetical protein [Streptomyces phaeochromogenes]MDQ0949911.1 hypothetical protein [Streptomyces phaeochromogenes]